jgi:hypothetical protein
MKACHTLHCHVLALEPNMDVFTKVFEPLVVVPIHEATCPIINIDDEDLLVEKQPKRILVCE